MSEIKVKIIADSKSSVDGKRITTFEAEYPRFIHSELMTHRMFSRNAASSRAIPVSKMIEAVRSAPASPIHWGKNQPGMQAKEELDDWNKGLVEGYWEGASHHAARLAEDMNSAGAHKQIVNRILEPFQMMKTVLTATEFDNFFWLRNHEDSQPEIKRLAELMLEAVNNSEPVVLSPGEWHVPYYEHGKWDDRGGGRDKFCRTLEDALAISSSCCAQVSYRKLDDSLEKAKDIFSKLIDSKPCHASPTEHQATPMKVVYEGAFDINEILCVEGTTHVDKEGNVWSGNFMGWIQHRQLIPDNVCNNYEENV